MQTWFTFLLPEAPPHCGPPRDGSSSEVRLGWDWEKHWGPISARPAASATLPASYGRYITSSPVALSPSSSDGRWKQSLYIKLQSSLTLTAAGRGLSAFPLSLKGAGEVPSWLLSSSCTRCLRPMGGTRGVAWKPSSSQSLGRYAKDGRRGLVEGPGGK